jgi:Tol biopolymer transport system component
MLTGRTAFEGKTRASLLGAILKDEPPRVSTLVPRVPPALDRVIGTCLAKDPDDRYQTARDLLRDLKWAASSDAAGPVPLTPAAAPPGSSRVAWSIAAVSVLGFLAAATVAVRHYIELPQRPDVVRFAIAPLENRVFGGPRGPGTGLATQIAVSPDGRSVAFVTGSGNGNFEIWLRRLDALTSVPIVGTDGASFPFWSPDGTAIAFFADGKLKRVAIGGGPAVELCDAPMGRGGTWAPDGTIVFAPAASGPLHRVSSAGGIATPVSTLDTSYGELGHRWPRFLPDGRSLLFTAVTGAANVAPKPSTIKWMSLGSGTATTLITTESQGDYMAGHLVFYRDGILLAQPFDAVAGRLHGEPFPVAENVGAEGSRLASFSAASTGTLVYSSGGRVGTRLTWTDRSGNVLETVGEQASYTSVALSPDERRAAVALTTGPPLNRDIWLIELRRGVMTRLTFQSGEDTSPAWSPDGTQLVFQSMRPGAGSLRSVRVGGTAVDEPLIEQAAGVYSPSDWSSDGRHILYSHAERTLGAPDLWALPTSGDRKPIRLTETPYAEAFPVLSPDGRWFAYTSDEARDNQVYVQPFPPTGRKYLVSRDGGSQPLWRRDGRELYFLTQDATLYSVTVATVPEFEAGIPQRLFASPAPSFTGGRAYAVSRDGQRFLFAAVAQVSTAPLHVVLNWSATR